MIDQDLDARILALQLLAEDVPVNGDLNVKDLYQVALGFRKSFGSHVALADAEMRVLFSTRAPLGAVLAPLSPGASHGAVPAAFRTGKPAIGDIFFGPIAQKQVVAMAVPVVRAGKPTMVLLTTVDIKQFESRIHALTLPRGWTLTVLDGKGDAIARHGSPPNTAPGASDSDLRFVAKSGMASWSVQCRCRALCFARRWWRRACGWQLRFWGRP